jgi:hypothetical protein
MKNDIAAVPVQTLWGIYYTDREYARQQGDPLRTVIEAQNKLAAEEAARNLGFDEAWAHPITPEEIKQAKWLPTCRSIHRAPVPVEIARRFNLKGSIRMQPTQREITDAIRVLQALSRKLDNADGEEARKNAPEDFVQRSARLNQSRIVSS